MQVSVVIPTYRRETELLNTIDYLLNQSQPAKEIIVVDQTEQHSAEVDDRLTQLDRQGVIGWVRRSQPSIPEAMNAGLTLSGGGIVLFVDDDIEPDKDLIANHLTAYQHEDVALVAGRVIQPWEKKEPQDSGAGPRSKFNAPEPTTTEEFPGGNFSVLRAVALEIGGFDENFLRAAYHYEREFADRLISRGYRIFYQPAAWLYHLHAVEGGVRSYGEHQRTMRPGHSVGAYYYFLTTRKSRTAKIAWRLVKSFVTRFHLSHPWYIPVTLFAEVTGLLWAVRLYLSGQKLLQTGPCER